MRFMAAGADSLLALIETAMGKQIQRQPDGISAPEEATSEDTGN